MIDIGKEFLVSGKLPGIALLLFSITTKIKTDSSLILKNEDFSEDEVPGDNFPHVLMNRYFETK